MVGETQHLVDFSQRRSSKPSTGSPSEDGDAMSSISELWQAHTASYNSQMSGAMDMSRRSSTTDRPSVIGLREKLLREAREERKRYLDLEETRRKATLITEGRSVANAETQTDPVAFASSAASTKAALGTSALVTGNPSTWSSADEEAQAEALRTIEMLRQRSSKNKSSEMNAQSRASELERELESEKAARQELETKMAQERNWRVAAQQQVMCLEYELDGKEAALQVAERQLEKRGADLDQAQRVLDMTTQATAPGSEDFDLRSMRTQLEERNRQLELKESHIQHLLSLLNKHGTSLVQGPDPMQSQGRLNAVHSAYAGWKG
eukprot:TRINITY_DN82603_c0_g1_i1.p1 TRINITY_DN82603_c0_g1~~TRINITY_DN82603_c0_g1_i1.p1  ORF type:complete len:323 (+),score=77.46 TRINITY_DN82603_c0_g1_i1:91-1059(+)